MLAASTTLVVATTDSYSCVHRFSNRFLLCVCLYICSSSSESTYTFIKSYINTSIYFLNQIVCIKVRH